MELSLSLKKIKWQNDIGKGLISEKNEKAVIKFTPNDLLPVGYSGVSFSKFPLMNALARNSEL